MRRRNKVEKVNIIAIDPATKTGWAVDPTIFGTWDLRVKRDESWGMRLVRFKSKLRELAKAYPPTVIVYERPGGRNTGAIITQSKIIGIIESLCNTWGVEYKAYSSSEIKKFATGKGNANKQVMIEYAKKLYGYEGEDDNEADALHLWHLANQEFNIH